VIPHRGAFVTSLTARDAAEIFSLRAELESYAARLALEKGPLGDETIARLEETLLAIDTAVDADDVMNTIDAVMEFHRLIAEESEHGLLLNTLATLRTQTRRVILYTKLHESDPFPEVTSHSQLLDVLRSGDPNLAEREMQEHIAASGERLVMRMKELEADLKA
jgi:DNA-binding GntR family transcriptional regulator